MAPDESVAADRYRWSPSFWFRARARGAPSFPQVRSVSEVVALDVVLEPPTPSIDLQFPEPRRFQLRFKDLEVRSSQDLLFFEAVDTKAYDLADVLTGITVTADLFEPLGGVRYGGKRYSPDGMEQAEIFKAPSVSRDESGYRKSFTVEKPTGLAAEKRRTMTIWDLIFPLLEPPLSFDFEHFIGLPNELYPFQRDGVRFLAERESALLGDEMGMGKTVQCIVAMRLLFQSGRVQSALLVVPLALLVNWNKELEKWAPTLSGVTVGIRRRYLSSCPPRATNETGPSKS